MKFKFLLLSSWKGEGWKVVEVWPARWRNVAGKVDCKVKETKRKVKETKKEKENKAKE